MRSWLGSSARYLLVIQVYKTNLFGKELVVTDLLRGILIIDVGRKRRSSGENSGSKDNNGVWKNNWDLNISN